MESLLPLGPRAPWRVTEAEALSGFWLRVRFNDGTSGIVEMAAFANSDRAGVFAGLRDENAVSKGESRSGRRYLARRPRSGAECEAPRD